MTDRLVKIVVGMPKDGKTEPSAYDNRMDMAFRLGVLQTLSHDGRKEFCGTKFTYPEGQKFSFEHLTAGRVFTPLARERIAELAQDKKADYLFMVDDDMLCPNDLFEQLYKHNVDIVAALAFNRYMPHKPVCYEIKTGYDNVEKKEYFINFPIIDYPRNTLVQCDAVGFGAVLIKMSVFETVKKPWFMTMSGAGEDISFCWKAGKAGVKIYMDTATKLGHLGDPQIIDEQTYDNPANQEMIRGEVDANKK
jgi:hypothetical protein